MSNQSNILPYEQSQEDGAPIELYEFQQGDMKYLYTSADEDIEIKVTEEEEEVWPLEDVEIKIHPPDIPWPEIILKTKPLTSPFGSFDRLYFHLTLNDNMRVNDIAIGEILHSKSLVKTDGTLYTMTYESYCSVPCVSIFYIFDCVDKVWHDKSTDCFWLDRTITYRDWSGLDIPQGVPIPEIKLDIMENPQIIGADFGDRDLKQFFNEKKHTMELKGINGQREDIVVYYGVACGDTPDISYLTEIQRMGFYNLGTTYTNYIPNWDITKEQAMKPLLPGESLYRYPMFYWKNRHLKPGQSIHYRFYFGPVRLNKKASVRTEKYFADYIKRAELRPNTSGNSAIDMQVTTGKDHPVAKLFQGAPPEQSVTLKIHRLHAAHLDKRDTIFKGIISQATFTGSECKLTAKMENWLEKEIPRGRYQYFCINRIYDHNCRLNKEDWQANIFIDKVENKLTVYSADFANYPDGYFVGGCIYYDNQTRMIETHKGNIVTIRYPFLREPHNNVFVTPGCAHLFSICARRFQNTANFTGCPYVPPTDPEKNPTGKGAYWMDSEVIQRDTDGFVGTIDL